MVGGWGQEGKRGGEKRKWGLLPHLPWGIRIDAPDTACLSDTDHCACTNAAAAVAAAAAAAAKPLKWHRRVACRRSV